MAKWAPVTIRIMWQFLMMGLMFGKLTLDS
ncbi:hypothetical protein Gohar_020920 [Gossypium harknessii]|uniref:Uncharacterized protein n=1 Tax=Gossypium harknessii TaxID=34285 RepID=A0A7J9I0L7_9ROSI|nr:hypothetical protein [Gossypium harknessii]